MAQEARSWGDAIGATLLKAAAALIVLVAGLAILFLLPATLVIVAMDFSLWSPGGAAGWFALVWFPLAFAAALYGAVTGLDLIDRPSAGGVARLVGIVAATFFTFPPFWLPA